MPAGLHASRWAGLDHHHLGSSVIDKHDLFDDGPLDHGRSDVHDCAANGCTNYDGRAVNYGATLHYVTADDHGPGDDDDGGPYYDDHATHVNDAGANDDGRADHDGAGANDDAAAERPPVL